MKKLIVAGALLVLGAACTQETPYKTQFKESVEAKASIDIGPQYVYVPSYQTASRSSNDAIPYFMGEEQLVKLRFAKDSLELVALDSDKRFQDNETNNKIILKIPIRHLSFRCAQDRFGECQNREEENNEIPDLEKDYFKPDFAAARSVSLSTLPADLTQYFNGCYEERDSKAIGYEITKDAINFKVEKTYRIAGHCLGEVANFEELKDSVVSIIHHHSIVKLDALASADYQPVDYPDEDERTFGFFRTERYHLDSDFREVESKKTQLMNRWNPEKSEIVYYLSDEFAKPQNEGLKKATYVAFERINNGLAAAGAKFRLVLKDPAGKDPGDIRNNMIILVEDPSGAGLLGYGPTVPNPHTGEILSARTVMYSGIMTTSLRDAYEEVRLSKLAKKLAPKEQKQDQKQEQTQAPPVTGDAKASAPKTGRLVKLNSSGKLSIGSRIPHLASHRLEEIKAKLQDYTKYAEPEYPDLKLKDQDSSRPQTRIELELARQAGRLDVMSKHCMYPVEYFNFEDAAQMSGLEEILEEEGELKPWDQLSDDAKTRIMAKMLPVAYIPTLIHEVGHNLGLRHNFAGSEDKANWYAPGEIPGLNREVKSSSMMEYAFRHVGELPTLGKYDIAALRFGYARQVEVEQNGGVTPSGSSAYEMVSVASTLGQFKKNDETSKRKLRSYKFCTDENAGAGAGCKRFDEGTNYTEIAQHFIDIYNKQYSLRNFRNGRRDFSMFNDHLAIAGRFNLFKNLRLVFEFYERLQQYAPPEHEVWKTDPFFMDVQRAAVLGGKFLVDVLRTPDVTCRIMYQEKEGGPFDVKLYPLAQISTDVTSCFELELPKVYKVIGQGGRLFQSKKSPESTNAYGDQIDVRGIWIDKLVAAELLFARELGSPTFDEQINSYVELEGVREELADTVAGIFLDDLSGSIEMVHENGKKKTLEHQYSLFEGHTINQPLNPVVNKMLDLPRGETLFIDQLAQVMKRKVPSKILSTSSREFMDLFSTYRISALDAVPDEVERRGGIVEEIDGFRYIAFPENQVTFIALDSHRAVRLLDSWSKEELGLLVKALASQQGEGGLWQTAKARIKLMAQVRRIFSSTPEGGKKLNLLTPELMSLRAETVEKLAKGQLKSREYYARLISTILPSTPVR